MWPFLLSLNDDHGILFDVRLPAKMDKQEQRSRHMHGFTTRQLHADGLTKPLNAHTMPIF